MIPVYSCPTHGRLRSDHVRDKAEWDGPIKVCRGCRQPVTSELGYTYQVKAEFQDAGTDNPVKGTFTLDALNDEDALGIVRRAIEASGPVDWLSEPSIHTRSE